MAYTLGPMLAGKYDPIKVEALLRKYGHLHVQPKIDGFRLIVWDGVAMSRSWKPWTNRFLQAWAKDIGEYLHGMDGEFFVGHQYRPEGFRDTMSGGRAEDGASELGFYWFDDIKLPQLGYQDRFARVKRRIPAIEEQEAACYSHSGMSLPWNMKHHLIPSYNVDSMKDILELEEEFLGQGFEGAIIRVPNMPYKFGRGTPSAGPLIKMKRFEDSEAVIIGYEPRYHNANEATKSELGNTVRSSHQENQIAEERMGAFTVQLLDRPTVVFNIGVFKGYTLSDREKMWQNRISLLNQVVKFTHQGYGGGYDVPRLPVLIGFRNPIDLS